MNPQQLRKVFPILVLAKTHHRYDTIYDIMYRAGIPYFTGNHTTIFFLPKSKTEAHFFPIPPGFGLSDYIFVELVAADTVNIKMLPPTDYCQAAASRTYAFADGVEDLTCLPPEAISRSLLEQGTWQLSTWRSSFYFVQLNAIMPRDSERMLREVQVFHCDLDIGKGGVRVNVHEIDEQRMRVPYDPDGVLRERYHKALDGLSSTPPLPAQPASVPPPPPVKPPLPQPPTPAAPQDAAALKPSTATRSTADRGREPISRAAKLFPGFKPPLPTTDS